MTKVTKRLMTEEDLAPGDAYVCADTVRRVGFEGAAVYMMTDERDADGDRYVVALTPGESVRGLPRTVGQLVTTVTGREVYRVDVTGDAELAK